VKAMKKTLNKTGRTENIKPGFHSNAIACVEFHATNASASQQECSVEAVATMIGCLPTQAIAFEWKPGFTENCFDTWTAVVWEPCSPPGPGKARRAI